MHCHNFDDYDRAFAILRQQNLLAEWADQPDLEFVSYDLVLSAGTLREHLTKTGVLPTTSQDELMGCFLSLASKLGKYPPALQDQPIPVASKVAPIPPAFVEAVLAFNDAGYCLVSDGRMRWLPKISAVMEAEGLWISGRSAIEIRREWLGRIWETMPDELKVCVRDRDGYVNSLSLLAIMRRHWDPDFGWREDGPAQQRVDLAMALPIELAEMVNSRSWP
jgi:hypothetical protein